MDIRELESVVRLAAKQAPSQAALASLAAGGVSALNLTDEFAEAVRTLVGKKMGQSENSILKTIQSGWV